MEISPVCSSRDKQVRTRCLERWVSSARARLEVTNWPRFMTIPHHRLSSKLALSSRCRNTLTMFVSPYHSHSRNSRKILIQPSSMITKVLLSLKIFSALSYQSACVHGFLHTNGRSLSLCMIGGSQVLFSAHCQDLVGLTHRTRQSSRRNAYQSSFPCFDIA